MYQLNATRVLYPTSKYAPLAVLRLDITVPVATAGRAQICESLQWIDNGSTVGLLSPSSKDSPVNMYADLVLALQQRAGHSVQYCRVQEMDTAPEYRVFIEYEEESVALRAAESAIQLLNGVQQHQDNAETQKILEEFIAFSRPRALDSNSRVLIRAAARNDIPVIRPVLPTPDVSSATELQNDEFQLGWGTYQQRFKGVLPEKLVSSNVLAQLLDRAQLYPKLTNACIPMPAQDFEFLNRNQLRRAQRSAQRIGYPVIIRPRAIRLFQYRFAEDYVFGPLHDENQVALAVKYLREKYGLGVWVESYVTGDQYRFLVVNGAVLSVVRCNPPVITGDGARTIADLVGPLADEDILFRLQLAGFALDDVLERNVQLALRGSGTVNNGGRHEDITMEIPEQFKVLAARIAEQSGLRALAGIELVIDKLSGDAKKPNCVVSNIILDPDLHMFEQLCEQPDRIGDEYMAALFPDGATSRIPTVAVTGTNGKTTTCRMVAQILRSAGLRTGLTCSDGVYLDTDLLMEGDSSGIDGAINLFVAADVEAAVLETARGGLANKGIAFDHCDVGACLNVAGDHLGEESINTLDEMAVHKRQVIERTTGTVILNADDPRCLAMQEHTTAGEVILVTSNSSHPAAKTHCEAGGRVISIHSGAGTPMVAVLTSDGQVEPLMAVEDIPASFGAVASYNVMNAMFAIAVSLGLGIEQAVIVAALKAFKMGIENTPGRLNEITGFPFRVIVDAAHNPHGLQALLELTNRLTVQGKKIINFGVSGRFSDDDIIEFARLVAGNFDLYCLKNYHMDRDLVLEHRQYEEVPRMLKRELIRLGVPEESILVELDVLNSLNRSLENAQNGDFLLVLTRVQGNDKMIVLKALQAAAEEMAMTN